GPFGLIVLFVKDHFDQIVKIVSAAIDAIIDFFVTLPAKLLSAIGDILSTVFAASLTAATWFDNNGLLPFLKWFTVLPGKAFKALGDIMSTVWHDMLAIDVWFGVHVELPFLRWVAGLPGKAFTALGDILGTVFKGVMSIASWLDTNVGTPFINFFTSLPGKIGSALESGLGSVLNFGGKIVNDIIKGINDGINLINSNIPSVFGVSLFPHIPDIPLVPMAYGGIMPAMNGGTA